MMLRPGMIGAFWRRGKGLRGGGKKKVFNEEDVHSGRSSRCRSGTIRKGYSEWAERAVDFLGIEDLN